MTQVTIGKALKIKNRIAEKIKKIDMKIRENNSFRLDIGSPFDTLALFENERILLTDQLVEVKSKIAKANFDIQEKIFRIAELKGLIAFIGNLNTTNGKVANASYNRRDTDPELVEYIANITQADVDKFVNKYQNELDNLQDEIDEFNATHKVELSF